MRAITLSRVAAALTAFTLVSGCSDYTAPPNEPSTPRGLTLVPSSATLGSGQVLQLTATLRDEFGDALAGVTVSWRSSNDAVATISSRGDVVERGAGRAVNYRQRHGEESDLDHPGAAPAFEAGWEAAMRPSRRLTRRPALPPGPLPGPPAAPPPR